MHSFTLLYTQISDNILKDPKNEKFCAVNLSSSAVERKLLPAVGALEVLFLIGFEEVRRTQFHTSFIN